MIALYSTRSYVLHVGAPYRLDLAKSALRRLSTNIVDPSTPDGVYMRALPGVEIWSRS
jgi:hypothetical protein